MESIKSKAQVIRQGDQWVIIVDQNLLDQMHIDGEVTLDAMTDGVTLVLVPEQDEERRAAFLSSIARIKEQYGSVFKRLAE